jgi:hypothetical protein
MVTMSLCVLISAAVAASHLFGARMTELTQTKINTSDKAVQLMRLLGSDIRNARKVSVGNGSASSFVAVPVNSPQQGNALEVYPTEDLSIFVRYYRNGADNTLTRIDDDGSSTRLAIGVTNATVFTLENYAGAVLTDRQRNSVIGIDLRFNRLENPDVPLGPQHYYKSYRFRTRIAQPML